MTKPEDPDETLPLEDPFPEDVADESGAAEEVESNGRSDGALAAEAAEAAAPFEEPLGDEDPPAAPPPPKAVTVTGRTPAGASLPTPAQRPDLLDRQEPLYRDCKGYRLRLEAPDLARLRELPGSRGKSDAELGESFFDGQAERIAASVDGDVPSGAELRVVVDPYSRQAFVALENQIRGILSF